MTEFNFDTVFDETMQTHNLDTVVILGHLNPSGSADLMQNLPRISK